MPNQSRSSVLAQTLLEVLSDNHGRRLQFSDLHKETATRLDFVPAESAVSNALRSLIKADPRCRKVGRDAYAWVLEGEEPPSPPIPPNVAKMIALREDGQTLDQIGSEFGVTRERVRQLIKKHGGPTSEKIRTLRASQVEAAKRAHQEGVAALIRQTLTGGALMTISEVAEVTGIDNAEIARCWPQDLAHRRLWVGQSEVQWTHDDILAALVEASAYEFPLTAKAYSDLRESGQVQGPSTPLIGKRFRSWSAACEAAGVVAGEPRRQGYESKWSDTDLLQVALAYILDPEWPSSAHRFDEWKRINAPDGPSGPTLRNRFGSWTEVKRRAIAQEEQTK